MRALAIVSLALCIASATCQIALEGSGTTNPSTLFKDSWIPDFKAANAQYANAAMTYRAIGSGGGISDLINEMNDWAAADVPLTDDEHIQLGTKKVLHLPFVLGAVNVFHNMASLGTNNLNFTATVLAKVLQRNITTWDDTEIMAINPALTVPANQAISVVRRMDGSSSTNNLSEYLASAAPDDWVLGTGKVLPWPDGTTAVMGSGAMSTQLKTSEYTIGYVDVGFGRRNGLKEAALQNKAGQFLTADEANVETVAQNIPNIPASNSDTWDNITLINQDGANVWPVTTFSYFLIYEDLSFLTREQGQLLVAFIEYCLSTDGQNTTETAGFFPVPSAILNANAAGLANIVLAPAPTDAPTAAPTDAGSDAMLGRVSAFLVAIACIVLFL